ncbi:MAG: hypothetical protein ACXVEF_44525 [Polyangiales bacterium]
MEVPPFPAGTSPFRQKGNAYLGDQRYLDEVVTGGFRACVEGISDPGARTFFAQRFSPSEWYDAYPGALLELSAARIRGAAFDQHRRKTGAWHAQQAARGIYGALLRLLSNESVALWVPRISSLYFEFGKSDTRVSGPREVLATRRGVPRELAQWLCYASYGFGEETLRIAGARDASIETISVEPDGRDYGRELVQIQLRIRWS